MEFDGVPGGDGNLWYLRGHPRSAEVRTLLAGAVGGTLPDWQLFAETSIVVRLEKGQTLNVAERATLCWVLDGVMRTELNLSDSTYITGYPSSNDIIVQATPAELYQAVNAANFETIPAVSYLNSPLICQRPIVTAVGQATVVVGPLRIFALLAARHAQWRSLMASVLVMSIAWHMLRETNLLTLSKEQQYLRFLEDNPRISSLISQREIARYLRMTPVGLSRMITRLRNSGANEAGGGVSVCEGDGDSAGPDETPHLGTECA